MGDIMVSVMIKVLLLKGTYLKQRVNIDGFHQDTEQQLIPVKVRGDEISKLSQYICFGKIRPKDREQIKNTPGVLGIWDDDSIQHF